MSNKGINRREFIRRSGLVTAGTVALKAGNKVIWASDPGPASVPDPATACGWE